MKLDVKKLETYKKAELQQLANDLGVSTSGTIKELATRCAEVEIEEADASAIEETDAIENENVETADTKTEVDTEQLIEVEAIQKYKDLELERIVARGEKIKVEESRALYLIGRKLVKK